MSCVSLKTIKKGSDHATAMASESATMTWLPFMYPQTAWHFNAVMPWYPGTEASTFSSVVEESVSDSKGVEGVPGGGGLGSAA